MRLKKEEIDAKVETLNGFMQGMLRIAGSLPDIMQSIHCTYVPGFVPKKEGVTVEKLWDDLAGAMTGLFERANVGVICGLSTAKQLQMIKGQEELALTAMQRLDAIFTSLSIPLSLCFLALGRERPGVLGQVNPLDESASIVIVEQVNKLHHYAHTLSKEQFQKTELCDLALDLVRGLPFGTSTEYANEVGDEEDEEDQPKADG